MPEVNLKLNPCQYKALNSKAKITFLLGGRAVGKSWFGSFWTMNEALSHPNGLTLIGCNVPSQVNSVMIPAIERMCKQCSIPIVIGKMPPWQISKVKTHTGVISFANGHQLIARSLFQSGLDRNVRGLEVGAIWIDEIRDCPEQAFDTALACLRYKIGSKKVLLTSTPNGRGHWTNKRLIDPMTRHSKIRVITGRTSENKENLPEGFEDMLRSHYSAALAQQELDGAVIDQGSGRCYEFDRIKNVGPCKPWEDIPLIFSIDLNVEPMCGVVMQINQRARTCQILDEFIIEKDARTIQMVELFKKSKWWRAPWIGASSSTNCIGFFYQCDEAGRARNTKGDSDVAIMQQAFRGLAGARTLNGVAKGSQVDRINATNCLLDPIGNNRMMIDPRCQRTIADFESVQWSQDGERRSIEKRDKGVTHLCVDEETKILTPSGPKAINRINPYDEIVTHFGVGRALWVGAVKEDNFVEIMFKDGTICQVTEKHPWLTNQGWTKTNQCHTGTEIITCSTERNTLGTEDIGIKLHGLSEYLDSDYIKQSGISIIRILEHRMMQFITSTIIPRITTQKTCNSCLVLDTCRIMSSYLQELYRNMLGLRLPNGIALKLAKSFIEKLLPCHIRTERRQNTYANIADTSLKHLNIEKKTNTALENAEHMQEEKQALTTLSENVTLAEKTFLSISTNLRSIAQKSAQHIPVKSIKKAKHKLSWSLESTSGSFCLSNGCIMSNTDAATYPIAQILPVQYLGASIQAVNI